MAIATERAAMSMGKVGGSSSEVKDWSSYTPVRVRNYEEAEAATRRREAKKFTKKNAGATKGTAGKPYVARSSSEQLPSATAAATSHPHPAPSVSSGGDTASVATTNASQTGGCGAPESAGDASRAEPPNRSLFPDGSPVTSTAALDKVDSVIFDATAANGGPAKESVEHWRAIARRLKHELTTCQRRSASELMLRDQEVRRHQAEAETLREDNEKLTAKLNEMMRAMDELKREGDAELARCGRENAVASRRAAAVERRLAGHEEDLEKKLSAAALREESLKKERDALACGLAAVAESAVGGKGVTPAVLLKEAEAAIAEGADPLPRKKDSWIKFTYSNQISGDSLALRKVGCDGDRAVSSLVSSVDRLHRRRKEAIRAEVEALEQIESLHVVIERVEREYEGVRSALDILEEAAGQLTHQRGTSLSANANRGKPHGLSARVSALAESITKVVARMEKSDMNVQRLKARVLELEFYGKLHEYIVDEAKSQVVSAAAEKSASVRDAGLGKGSEVSSVAKEGLGAKKDGDDLKPPGEAGGVTGDTAPGPALV